MKDSQHHPKKQRVFLKKKGNKSAPLKAQEPLEREPQAKEEQILLEQQSIIEKDESRIKNPSNSGGKQESRDKESKEKSVTRNSYFMILRKKLFKPYSIKKKEAKKQAPTSLLKQYETDLQLILIPLILLAILAMLMLLNNHYLELIAKNKLPQVASITSMQTFPLAENVIPPDISAKAAIVLDADSQVVLVSKNPELRFSMASTTKIMTAITALDYFKDEEVLTVMSSGVEGSVIGLQQGEKLVFKDLLYAMMLPSANDAAVAIADNYVDGREAFIKKMNEKALLLHLMDTHFSDPAGLNDDENYTTVKDLARLGSYAMKNEKFVEIVGTKQKTITNTYYSKQYLLTNLNRLLGIDGVNGIKTGTTEAAGEVLVTSKVAKGHTFIIIVMNSTDRFADTKELIKFVDEKVQYVLPPQPNAN